MSMRAVLGLLLTLCTVFPQGTVVFHNRVLTDPATGLIYNAPFSPFCPGDTAQLYMVTGTGAAATFTPLFPTQTFRDPPFNHYLIEPVLVAIPGAPAGTTGIRVVVRAWHGAETYESNEVLYRGQSNDIILGPLGGIPASGPPITPPTLDGLLPFAVVDGGAICVPEPSTLALALVGFAAVAFRRTTSLRKTFSSL